MAASICSNKDDRAKCCRYINAFIAVSIARYANATSNLGVTSNLSDICLHSISQTMEMYGVPHNATVFCGFGTKILVNYACRGRTTVTQMLQSPRFADVMQNCKVPLSADSNCKICLNAGIIYLHHLVGMDDNMTLSTCRDATFAALASQTDDVSAVGLASCFFGVQGLNIPPGMIRLLFLLHACFFLVWCISDVGCAFLCLFYFWIYVFPDIEILFENVWFSPNVFDIVDVVCCSLTLLFSVLLVVLLSEIWFQIIF